MLWGNIQRNNIFSFFPFPFYFRLIRNTADSAIYKSMPPKGIWFIFLKWMCGFYYAWQVWLESKYENCILRCRPLGNELNGNTNISTIEKCHNMKALSKKRSKQTVGEEQISLVFFFCLYLYYSVLFTSFFFLSRKEMPALEQKLSSGLSSIRSILSLCSFDCPNAAWSRLGWSLICCCWQSRALSWNNTNFGAWSPQ